MVRDAYHIPTPRDKIWDGSRIEKGLQPNGYILNVYKQSGVVSEVQVMFHDDPNKVAVRDRLKMYDVEQLHGAYEGEVIGYKINA